MVIVSEKLELILGFHSDGNACFVCMCVLAMTLALSFTHDRLIFYKCLFLCLVLIVMVSEKLGLVLGKR